MDEVLSLLNEYRIIVGLVTSLLLTSVALKIYWDEVSFYWLRIACTFPLVGKIARLKKDLSTTSDGWFHAEKALMAEFEPYFEDANKDANFFDSCKNYLKKVTENGRKELPFFLWIVLIALVFGEAMGFSYVLAGFTIPGASEDLQQKAALMIAFMVSALLVFLTHLTGSEIHRNSLVKKVRTWFNQQSSGGENLSPNTNVDLTHDHIDDNDQHYKQLLNRIDANDEVTPKYPITILTLVFILLVAIGSTYVRGQVLNDMLIQEQQMMSEEAQVGAYSDPYGSPIPKGILTEVQESSDAKTGEDSIDAQMKGGWGTFIVLAVIFVFLQFMGIMIGKLYGFAGKESKDAFKYIGPFKTRAQFEKHHQRQKEFVAQIAQKNLANLQKRLAKYAASNATESEVRQLSKTNSHRTFYQYITLVNAEQKSFERNSHDANLAHQAYVAQETSDRAKNPVTIQEFPSSQDLHASTVSPIERQPNSNLSAVSTEQESEAGVSEQQRRMQLIRERRAAEEEKKKQVEEEAYMATLSDDELESYMVERGIV